MKRKQVLYLLRTQPEHLPPCMAQIHMLCRRGCSVTAVTVYASDHIRACFQNDPVTFLTSGTKACEGGGILSKALALLRYRHLVRDAQRRIPHDMIWIGSADTARYCRDLLLTHAPTVLNIFELYDRHPALLREIRQTAQKAAFVIVPEYHRAHMLRVWLGLHRTPCIIPNKPYYPAADILPQTQKYVDAVRALGKKILLYQGWIGRDRDLTHIAEALASMEEHEVYALVLMGHVTAPDILPALQTVFPAVYHIPYLAPPQHLYVTALAHIGIAVYDDSSLNNLFCAPNKIYEYADRGVPILARDIPGLTDTVGRYEAGICTDTNDPTAIADAIRTLSANRAYYVSRLHALSDSCRAEEVIADILRAVGGDTGVAAR